MDVKLLIALAGIIVTAMMTDLNDAVTAALRGDIGGGLGFGHDPATWFTSLYVSAMIFGMSLSPWFVVTLSLRRWSLFVIGLTCACTVLIPAAHQLSLLYALRAIQGLCGGLTIPLLMTTALRALGPQIRLYGLAAYSLTATVFPNLADAVAAIWAEQGDGRLGWRFAFWEAIPLSAVAALLVWHGMPRDPVKLERFAKFDWRGASLVVVGLGSLSTMLEQGDRFDWFNAPTICVLAVISAVCVPLLIWNELYEEIPLLKLDLLVRPNVAFGLIALFSFSIVSLSATAIPSSYLTEVQGYRPAQSYTTTALIAGSQLALLPAMAVLLNQRWADARVVGFLGLVLILAACIGDSFLTGIWQRQQFYLWQGLQSAGDAMFVMSLLLLTTNVVKPEEGPYVSALVNTPRAVGEATGTWLLELVRRWRGGLHSDRVTDQLGQERFRLLQGRSVLPVEPAPYTALGRAASPPRFDRPGSLGGFRDMVEAQVTVLTLSDAFLVVGGLVVLLLIAIVLIPTRTLPPRIALAGGR